VELRILDEILMLVPSAFPKLLSMGKWLDSIQEETVYTMRKLVEEEVDRILDSRLSTQYALTLMCAQKVPAISHELYP